MTKLFILCAMFTVLFASAQDTIYKRNGESISSKIKEISNSEISYNRFDMLDGPLFKISKNDVRKIKYLNGTVDSFSVVVPSPVQIANNQPPTIIFRNKWGYKYNGHRLSEKEVLTMTLDKNKSINNLEVVSLVQAHKKNKLKQFVFGLGGAAIAAGIVGGVNGYINIHDGEANFDPLLFSGLAFAGAVVITTSIISRNYKKKRRVNIHKLAELYNQFTTG